MLHHQEKNSRGNYNYNIFSYIDISWAPHFHKNFELICVTEGEIFLTVNGNTEVMCAGDYALILSNQIHSFETRSSSRCWIAVFAEQFVPHFANRIERLEGEHSIFRVSDEVDALIQRKLVSESSSITMKKACFYAVCDEFMQNVRLTERKTHSENLVGSIFDYVSTHYKQSISLSDVANKLGYEYHYLSRLLNKGYQINFSRLVNEYRVDKAVSLLENSNESITDIAMESGFKSIRGFNHAFLDIMGISPREYRQSKERKENSLPHDISDQPNVT